MKIISKRQDYYDYVSTLYGKETGRVHTYERREVTGKAIDLLNCNIIRGGKELIWRNPRCPNVFQSKHSKFGAKHFEFRWEPGVLVFAGKGYPFFKVELVKLLPSAITPKADEFYIRWRRYLITTEMVYEFLNKYEIKIHRYSWKKPDKFEDKKKMNDYIRAFDIQNAEDLGLPCFVYYNEDCVIANPITADYGLQKLLTPEQAYQEMDMFIGVVSTIEPDMAIVNEQDRYKQKGFNKQSFRHPVKL